MWENQLLVCIEWNTDTEGYGRWSLQGSHARTCAPDAALDQKVLGWGEEDDQSERIEREDQSERSVSEEMFKKIRSRMMKM